MTLDLTFQDLKLIAFNGKLEKEGITLTLGWPLIPDLTTDATGTRGKIRFTVDERDLWPPGPQPVCRSPAR